MFVPENNCVSSFLIIYKSTVNLTPSVQSCHQTELMEYKRKKGLCRATEKQWVWALFLSVYPSLSLISHALPSSSHRRHLLNCSTCLRILGVKKDFLKYGDFMLKSEMNKSIALEFYTNICF